MTRPLEPAGRLPNRQLSLLAGDVAPAGVADLLDLYSQTKHAHWNVKGQDFIALHKLFDEINEAVEDYVDDIAERAVQLGGVVPGTMTCPLPHCQAYPWHIRHIARIINHISRVPWRSHFVDGSKGW